MGKAHERGGGGGRKQPRGFSGGTRARLSWAAWVRGRGREVLVGACRSHPGCTHCAAQPCMPALPAGTMAERWRKGPAGAGQVHADAGHGAGERGVRGCVCVWGGTSREGWLTGLSGCCGGPLHTSRPPPVCPADLCLPLHPPVHPTAGAGRAHQPPGHPLQGDAGGGHPPLRE